MHNDMTTHAAHALNLRIQKLEAAGSGHGAQLRRWRMAACGLLCALILGILAGGSAITSGVLDASAIILRGPDGSMRGSFVVGDDGGVRLTLFDTQSGARAGLWLDRTGYATSWGFNHATTAAPSHAGAAPASMQATSQPQFNGVQNSSSGSLMQRATIDGQSMLATNRMAGSTSTMSRQHGRPTPAPASTAILPLPAMSLEYQQPAYERTLPVPYSNGKLVTLASSCRVLERSREAWTCAYQLALRNETGMNVDQAFHVVFMDANGFVLGRQARILRLGPGRETVLTGEVSLSPDRAQQVTAVKLSVWEP